MNAERVTQTQKLREKVQSHQFVFISGVLQEYVSPYFKRSSTYLTKTFGAPKSPVLSPGTLNDLEASMTKLYNEILTIYEKSQKPLIVISHSKGSVIMHLILFKHPELVRDGIVKKSISLQGAFGGSKVADYIVSDHSSWFGKLLSPIFRLVKPIAEPLVSDTSQKDLRDSLNTLSSSDFNLVNDIIYYIRSTKVPRRTISYLRIFNSLLTKNYGKNDGMILVEDQMMDTIGTDLGVIDNIDHIDFILDRPLSASKAKNREVITQMIVEEIFN
jgi:hypothetical protein